MFAGVLHNEKELLTLIARGDEVAFTQLFNHYRNSIYSIAIKIGHSSILAEEAVQDVFMKIWLKRADLNHVQNFTAYLYTIVQNTMYRTLKRMMHNTAQTVQPCEELSSRAADPEDQLMEKQYTLLLQQGIDKLPNQQKQVYRLIREGGLKRNEVANMLNLHPETVKFHLSKAVKSLWSYCRLHLHLLIGFALMHFLSILFDSYSQ